MIGEEIATTLENLEANLKGSTRPNGERSMAWEHIAQQESEKDRERLQAPQNNTPKNSK